VRCFAVPKRCKPKCLHCKELFVPDRRNRGRQQFCSREPCRQASKAESQRRWTLANADYFKGSHHVERVQEWRKKNRDYATRAGKPRSRSKQPLQDRCNLEPAAEQALKEKISSAPLQDVCATQDPLLVGLISHLIDSALQDHIEETTRHLLAKGRRILGMEPGGRTNKRDENPKTNPLSATAPPHSRTV
jgi:hypothetical protein